MSGYSYRFQTVDRGIKHGAFDKLDRKIVTVVL